MNLDELTRDTAQASGLSNSDTRKAVQAMLSAMNDSLSRGEAVRCAGFGVFEVSTRAARTGRNPRTGVTIAVPARKGVRFRAGTRLKDAVNR